uniref:Tripartite motif-containing protein 5 n=1 Tax=Globodera pallida TaxID=36090 RepID=A0A183C2C1_GLOPA
MDPCLSFSNNALRIRERLAELNTKDLHNYFQGFRKLYDELLAKREEHKTEIIVYQQSLKDFMENLQKLREYLAMVRKIVTEENLRLSTKSSEVFTRMKENIPEMADKLEDLQQMQKRLAYLKFSKNFSVLLAEVRKYLRKGNYSNLLDNYRKLLRIPSDSPEYCIDAHCRHEYTVKSGSLAQFLQLELRSALSNVFSRIHFPFEEPVDLNTLHFPLHQSAQIMKCLHLVGIL